MARFTELGIERIKTPKKRETLKTEGNGLYLKITPKGKKSWHHYGKSRKWFKLGEYPALPLKEARELNDNYKEQTDKGLSPLEIDVPSSDPTVREFFDRWHKEAIDKNGNPWSEQYTNNVKYIFDADVLPFIGGAKVRDISKSNVAHIHQRILDRGAKGHARQVYMRLKRFFNYAAELDIIRVSPMLTLPVKGTINVKDRSLKAEELKVFLRELPRLDMDAITGNVLLLILRTGQRPTECAGINIDEVEGNWWTIPGERTKNGLAHRVYLTADVLTLLGEPFESGYFFESLSRNTPGNDGLSEANKKPIHRDSIAKALRRSIEGKEKTQKDKTPTLPLEKFTPHDLRRTCATHLAELGFTDDVIGAVLNHKKQTVTGIYNRHQYDKEKKKAMEAWNRKIAALTTDQKSGNVVQLYQ